MMQRVKDWGMAILLFLWILSLGITFVIFFEPLFHWSISWFGLENASHLSRQTLQENYHVLIVYLTQPWISTLTMPDFPSSPQGLFHFAEVKNWFMVNFTVFIATTVVGGWGLYRYYQQARLQLLLQPLRFLFYVPIVVVMALICFFDTIFVKFHELFFHNSAWIFDPRLDPIIAVLPEEFFMLCFVVVFVILLVGIQLAISAIRRLYAKS